MALRLLRQQPIMVTALLRPFRTQPLYALACVTTLALAVAAAASSFAVVKRALFDPLPYADSDRLVAVQTAVADNRTGSLSVFVFDDHAPGSTVAADQLHGVPLQLGDVSKR